MSRALVGLLPIGLAVLLILLWLPVDQLYIHLRRSSALVIEVTPGLRRSQSKLSCSTLASARSFSTIGGKHGGMLRKSYNTSRSRASLISSRSQMAERSRSLELILGSQGSSPSPPGSLLFPVAGTQTLPRLRPCREAPGVISIKISLTGEFCLFRNIFCGTCLESNRHSS